jgi:hypothetical protein
MIEKTRTNAARDAFSFAGGIAGLVVFFTTTLTASLAYGGAAGIAVTHGLGLGHPDHSLAAKAIIWGGMLLGAAATAAIVIILGAIAGALVYGLVGRHFVGQPSSSEEDKR